MYVGTLLWLNFEAVEKEPNAHICKLVRCFSHGHLHFKANFSCLFTYSNTIIFQLTIAKYICTSTGR